MIVQQLLAMQRVSAAEVKRAAQKVMHVECTQNTHYAWQYSA